MHGPLAGMLLIERDEAVHRAEALQKRLEEALRENDLLRQVVAKSDADCIYCSLPKVRMAECRSGFPGCGRMDDLMAAEQAHVQPE